LNTVTKAFLRYLPRRRSLALLHVLGIGCGVAAVIGMVFSARAALTSFAAAVRFLNGEASHSLESVAGPMDERVLLDLMEDPSVRFFAPVIDRRLRLENGEPVRLLGIDPFLDRAVRPRMFGNGTDGPRYPVTDPKKGFSFMLDSRSIALDAKTASRLGVGPGSTVNTSRGPFRIVAVFPSPSPEPLMVTDIGHAQRLFGLKGKIDRVDLLLEDEAAFLARYRDGFRIQSGRQKEKIYASMMRAFRLNLEALSLIALFVGVFLIYNTATFAVTSRRKDAAILLSIGARRGEIGRAFIGEILIFGVAGGLLGGTAGYVLSRFLTGLIGQTVSNLYFFLKPSPLPWSWSIPAAGALLGAAAGLAGSLFPLLELMRLNPVGIMQPKAAASNSAAIRRACLAGLLILGVTAILLFCSPLHVYVGFASAFTFLFGSSLLTGGALLLANPLLKGVLGMAGLPGRLAAGNIRQNLGRTAVAVAAFTVALSMSIGLGSMIGSFRQSLMWWMDTQIRADLYVGSTSEGVEVPESFYGQLAAMRGLGGVDPYRNVQIPYRGSTVSLAAVRADVLQKYTRFGWLQGGDENWERVKAGEVIVSESFCRNFKIAPGQMVELPGRAGPVRLKVAAAFYDYTTEHGLVMMDRSTYIAVFGDHTINSVGVFIDKDNPDGPALIREVGQKANSFGLPVFARKEMRDRILSVFDSTFAVTRSMRILAIIVAFFGIAGALLTLFVERQREFGIYRALGFSARQVAAMTLLEGLGMGIVSLACAMFAGTVLAVILIKVINLRSFNWTIFFYPAWGPYVTAAATAVLASAGAALYPVLKVLRTYPHMQLREE
jgi:putative ABC transport system permease protein